MSETLPKIYGAFIKAQAELPSIAKDKKAQAFGRGAGYDYADINAILDKVEPILNRNGLGLIQKTSGNEHVVTVESILFADDGSSISSGEFTVSTEGLQQKGVQAHGSAVTYARRYSLAAFLGLAYGTPDDDGYEATKPKWEEKKAKPAPKSAPKSAPKPTPVVTLKPEHNYDEMYKLIGSATDMATLNNLGKIMKMAAETFTADETNSLRALWSSKRDEIEEPKA